MRTPFDADVRRVIAAIPYGAQNAISRDELSAVVGLTDRQTRRCIAQARKDGFYIVNGENGKGYALEVDLDALEAHYRVEKSRALSTLARLAKLRRHLIAAGRDVK